MGGEGSKSGAFSSLHLHHIISIAGTPFLQIFGGFIRVHNQFQRGVLRRGHVAKFVESITDVRDGRTYIILTKEDGLVYKRVYDRIKDRKSLLLYSDNKVYAPYEVKMEHVLELWEFTCCINTQEYNKDELKLSSIVNMFQELITVV